MIVREREKSAFASAHFDNARQGICDMIEAAITSSQDTNEAYVHRALDKAQTVFGPEFRGDPWTPSEISVSHPDGLSVRYYTDKGSILDLVIRCTGIRERRRIPVNGYMTIDARITPVELRGVSVNNSGNATLRFECKSGRGSIEKIHLNLKNDPLLIGSRLERDTTRYGVERVARSLQTAHRALTGR